MKHTLIVTTFMVIGLSAWAKPQTVTLELPTMNCSLCPITVRKALDKVDGVEKAEVSYKTKLAIVTYEDTKTSPEELVQATAHAGYPASIVRPEK